MMSPFLNDLLAGFDNISTIKTHPERRNKKKTPNTCVICGDKNALHDVQYTHTGKHVYCDKHRYKCCGYEHCHYSEREDRYINNKVTCQKRGPVFFRCTECHDGYTKYMRETHHV
jgi:hypothetical protein